MKFYAHNILLQFSNFQFQNFYMQIVITDPILSQQGPLPIGGDSTCPIALLNEPTLGSHMS